MSLASVEDLLVEGQGSQFISPLPCLQACWGKNLCRFCLNKYIRSSIINENVPTLLTFKTETFGKVIDIGYTWKYWKIFVVNLVCCYGPYLLMSSFIQ